ncbi:MAG: helix-turn-helix domain-containing protein [Eubacteriales bacterium]|nr:helix-turn-helix domain-containing protein [Eubacteriales bacterium]
MDKMFSGYPDMMTVSQLQEALGIGRNAAYNLIRSNKMKSLKIGRNIRIPKIWLIEYIEEEWYNNDCNGLLVNGGVI